MAVRAGAVGDIGDVGSGAAGNARGGASSGPLAGGARGAESGPFVRVGSSDAVLAAVGRGVGLEEEFGSCCGYGEVVLFVSFSPIKLSVLPSSANRAPSRRARRVRLMPRRTRLTRCLSVVRLVRSSRASRAVGQGVEVTFGAGVAFATFLPSPAAEGVVLTVGVGDAELVPVGVDAVACKG